MSNLAEQLQNSLNKGIEYMDAGAFEKALDCFLLVLDSGFSARGSELFELRWHISKLGQKYPPSLQALSSRRDEKELLLKSGQITSDLVREWQMLNQILNDEEREAELLIELDMKGLEDAELFEPIITSNVEWFLENRRFDLLGKYLNDFGRSFCVSLADLEGEIYFPSKYSSEETLGLEKRRVLETARSTFEIALSCGKTDQADYILERVLAVLQDLETLRTLTNIAEKHGAESQRVRILQTAKKLFPNDQH